MIAWARERAGMDPEELCGDFPKIREWEKGELKPTVTQMKRFARKVHVAEGFFYFANPPEEQLPIEDFRTFKGRRPRPTPALLDVLHACRMRQDWYREYAVREDLPEVEFVGSCTTKDAETPAAGKIASTLGFGIEDRAGCGTWEEAFQELAGKAERSGVLVMVSGVVGNNNHRPLDPSEFRGFALSDRNAPVIFVNGQDSLSAQMFTLAHGLAHIWLGISALSDAGLERKEEGRREKVWCSAVAAELLVPAERIRSDFDEGESLERTLNRLSKRYRVSGQAVLLRLLQSGLIGKDGFDRAWNAGMGRRGGRASGKGGGGSFFQTLRKRTGSRFARALIVSTLEGGTLYRDAFRLLGLNRTATFDKLAEALEVA